ncbi:MAG TPA: hypothetical protein VK796_08315, partial [Cytophaga sp.]|nr:hypothetical protein [Cytophaga sp.]
YAKGKGEWRGSATDTYLARTGKWMYYYRDGYKKEMLQDGLLRHLWYVNGATAFKSTKIYSFRFHDWYLKNRSWYPSGQLKSEGLTDLDNNCKYGYYRSYTHHGKRWLEEYFVHSDLQGVSVYTDDFWRVRYFIEVDDMSFEDVSFDPEMLTHTTQGVLFVEAKEGYNELIYDLDTFRFTVQNGYMEGAYYHSEGRRGITQAGFYHHNYKTGIWWVHTPFKNDSYLDYCFRYKKGCEQGTCYAFLSDSMLLMKQHYRYSKRNGTCFSVNGFFSDPRYAFDDGFYFIEEKYRHDKWIGNYSKVYAADKSTCSIQYLKWKNKRICFLSGNNVHLEYYPNHQVKQRTSYNEKKKRGIKKTYDESGKLMEKVQITK